MTKSLNEMSVTEAASKAFEVLIYSEYIKDQKGRYEWSTPFEGSFEDYVVCNYLDDNEVYDSELEDYVPVAELKNFDTEQIWQSFHGEGPKGEMDGLTAEVVKSHGGEGEGDQYWMVISITDGDTIRYFRKDGWYASYDGGYLDGETYEVAPKERLVTYYE